jgi:hypothetical protein
VATDDWTPIRRGEPRVLGVHPQYSGLLRIEIRLDPSPPVGWAQGFSSPRGVGIPISMHPPEIRGGSIYITPPDDEVEKYVAHIDERIAAANRVYQDEVMPDLRRRAERDAAAKAEEQRRITDAQQRIDGMGRDDRQQES